MKIIIISFSFLILSSSVLSEDMEVFSSIRDEKVMIKLLEPSVSRNTRTQAAKSIIALFVLF